MSMDHNSMIEVIAAHRDGKAIQIRGGGCHSCCPEYPDWTDANKTVRGCPTFHFDAYDYRIKPEPPKPREWWLVMNDNDDPIGIRYAQTDGDYKPRVHVREVLETES